MIRMVCTTPNILRGVTRVSIKHEGTRKINDGNFISVSLPDHIPTPRTHEIGGSIDKNGLYPSTKLLSALLGFL
jgi:hypothetical protein